MACKTAKFRHIGIVVNDLSESVKFYRNYFNFKIEREMSEGGKYLEHLLNQKNIKVKTCKLSDKSGEIVLELLKFEYNENITSKNSLPRIYDLGPTHFAITVKNIENLFEKMVNENIQFLNTPIISVDKKAKVAFCKDPTGTLIELVELL